MRFRPANIRVIHRRGGSVDQLAGSRLRPRPDGLISRTRALCSIEHQNTEALSNTQVTIDRAGNTSEQFWNNDASNYLLSKTIKVIPTNNTTAGNYQITLYYTGAEVNGWQVPTGRLFANNQIIKVSNGFYIPDVTPASPHLSDITIATGTAGTIGTNYSIKSEFNNTGFSGFGTGYPCSSLSVFWTGTINTDWFNTGNWACGVLPGPTTDVIISSGLVNYPVINGNATIKSLTLKTGASCIVNPGFTLTLTGQ